jgi:hypothetical protein
VPDGSISGKPSIEDVVATSRLVRARGEGLIRVQTVMLLELERNAVKTDAHGGSGNARIQEHRPKGLCMRYLRETIVSR